MNYTIGMAEDEAFLASQLFTVFLYCDPYPYPLLNCRDCFFLRNRCPCLLFTVLLWCIKICILHWVILRYEIHVDITIHQFTVIRVIFCTTPKQPRSFTAMCAQYSHYINTEKTGFSHYCQYFTCWLCLTCLLLYLLLLLLLLLLFHSALFVANKQKIKRQVASSRIIPICRSHETAIDILLRNRYNMCAYRDTCFLIDVDSMSC